MYKEYVIKEPQLCLTRLGYARKEKEAAVRLALPVSAVDHPIGICN